MLSRSITIKKSQQDFINRSSINLSAFVRKKINKFREEYEKEEEKPKEIQRLAEKYAEGELNFVDYKLKIWFAKYNKVWRENREAFQKLFLIKSLKKLMKEKGVKELPEKDRKLVRKWFRLIEKGEYQEKKVWKSLPKEEREDMIESSEFEVEKEALKNLEKDKVSLTKLDLMKGKGSSPD